MIKIVSDSSTLYSSEEGKKLGLKITPLSVSIGNKTYREFDEVSSSEFVELVMKGDIPTSSQPSIGDKMEAYEAFPEDEIIDIAIADGLSGTYQSACMAKEDAPNKERIHVINSKTICGPQRYLVQKAMQLVSEGKSASEIITVLEESIENNKSFLIPSDFSFLKRGGRLTPLAATFGGMLKIVPIMTQTEDGKRLEKYGVKRTFKGAVEEIIKCFKEKGVNENYHLSISHADNKEKALTAKQMLEDAFGCETKLYDLSPAFITQGGPGCIAIQMIKK